MASYVHILLHNCELVMDSSKAQPAGETTAQPPLEAVDAVDQDVVDACDLAALGHSQSLTRKFDIWSILALAFCVLGTWSTFAQVSIDDYGFFITQSMAKRQAGNSLERHRYHRMGELTGEQDQ